MNNAHCNNAQVEQDDYFTTIPIANLDNVQPLGAPTDKVSPVDVSVVASNDVDDGQLTRRSKRQPDLLSMPLPPPKQQQRRHRKKRKGPCRRFVAILTFPFHARPGLGPVVVASLWKLVWNFRVVSELKYKYAPPLFGIDDERTAKAWDGLHNATQALGKMEEQCIQFGAAKCKEQFRIGRDVELEMIRQVHEENNDLLHGASSEWKQCMSSLNNTELALQDINFSGGMIPFVDANDKCTVLDLRELDAIVGGQARQEREGIEGYVQYLVDERNAQYLFLSNWGQYNVEYFLGELPKLEAELLLEINSLVSVALDGIKLVEVTGLNGFDGIIACVSPNGGPHQCKLPNADLAVSMEQLIRTAKSYIEYGEDQMQMAAMVIATLVDRYDWAVDQIELLVRVFSGIRNVLGRPFDLALRSFGSDIDLDKYAHLLPGALYVSPDLQLIDKFPELADWKPLFQDLVNQVAQLKQNVSSVASQVSDELEAKIVQLVDSIEAHFDKLLKDYQPPTHLGFLSLEEGAKVFFMDGQNLKEGIKDRIGNLGKTRAPIEATDEFVPQISNIALNETSAQVENVQATLFSWSFPTLAWIIEAGQFVVKNAWILDIIVRVWQVFRNVRKVWDRTAVPIPVIDLPSTSQQEEEQKRGKLMTVLTILTHDWIPTIALYSFSVASFVVLCLIYWVAFTSYKNGCVHSRTGSYVGRVVFTNYFSNPILLNVNNVQTKEAASVKSFHQSKCESARILTILNQTQQTEWLASIENDYGKTMDASSQLLNCIDFDDFQEFDEPDLGTCALPLDVTLGEKFSSCNWGECVIDCGQDTLSERLQQLVIDNTCILEEQYHAKFWLLLVIVFAYYSLQKFGSTIQECAPHLFPEKFGAKTVKINLERYIETGELLGSKGQEAEQVIRDAIARHLRINKIKACGTVLYSILLNAGWIALLWNMKRIIGLEK